MAFHRSTAQQLSRSAYLESLFRSAVCLRLWHPFSQLPRSSSVPAPSPCSGRPAAEGIRSGRSPSRPPPAASAGRAPAPGGIARVPEHDRDLDLRALIQEALDVALLGVVVVDP